MQNRRKVTTIIFLLLIYYLLVACRFIQDQPALQSPSPQATKGSEIAISTSASEGVIEIAQVTATLEATSEPIPTFKPSPTIAIQLKNDILTRTIITQGNTIPVTMTTVLTDTNTIGQGLRPEQNTALPEPVVIGYSYGGHSIVDYQLGIGENKVVIVGGMHGGYEWNTTLLAFALLDYYLVHLDAIPDSVALHIIPTANPDGQFAVTSKEGRFSFMDVLSDTIPGRFNGRDVDLNRNWDCQWMPTGTWRDKEVSAGTGPFSEPETIALRDYLRLLQPVVVIFYHSAANGVFAAGCPNLHAPSMELATTYGLASGYPVYESFFFYDVNGDASDWLSTEGIPSFSVELITHEGVDWSMNLAGVQAILKRYSDTE